MSYVKELIQLWIDQKKLRSDTENIIAEAIHQVEEMLYQPYTRYYYSHLFYLYGNTDWMVNEFIAMYKKDKKNAIQACIFQMTNDSTFKLDLEREKSYQEEIDFDLLYPNEERKQ